MTGPCLCQDCQNPAELPGDGRPHDYGVPCCCPDCTGPDGADCRPDCTGSRCVRCGRRATADRPETTAELLCAIVDTIAHTAAGQVPLW